MTRIKIGAAAVIAALLSAPPIGAGTHPVVVLADVVLAEVVQTGEFRGVLIPLVVFENRKYRNAFDDSGSSATIGHSVLTQVRDFALYDDRARDLGTFHIDAVGWATDGLYEYGCSFPLGGFGQARLTRTPELRDDIEVPNTFPKPANRRTTPWIRVKQGVAHAVSKMPVPPQLRPLVLSESVPHAASLRLVQIAKGLAADFVREHEYVDGWLNSGYQERGFPLAVTGDPIPARPTVTHRQERSIVTYRQGDGERRVVAVFRVPLTPPYHGAPKRAELQVVQITALSSSGAPRMLMSLTVPNGEYPHNDTYALAGIYNVTSEGGGDIFLRHKQGEAARLEVFTSSGAQLTKAGETASWGC